MKIKIITYSDKVHTNDGVECESFTVISIVYDNKFYLQVYVGLYACKIVDEQIVDFWDWWRLLISFFFILINGSYKCCIMIELI